MALDTFTGSNGTDLVTYSANWTYAAAAFYIQGNACAGNDATGGYAMAYWNAAAFNANQYAQANVVNSISGNLHGPAVRIADATWDGYGFGVNNAGRKLFKWVSGSRTQLASDATVVSAGDLLYLEVSGTALTSKVNGTTALTTSDSAHSSGRIGIMGSNNGTAERLDDFDGGDLAAGGLSIPVEIPAGMSRGMGRGMLRMLQ